MIIFKIPKLSSRQTHIGTLSRWLPLLLLLPLISQAGEPLLNEPIKPIEIEMKLDPKKVSLGRKLFLDPILSSDNSISCASCHNLRAGGADRGKNVSVGINNLVGSINSPTVYNSSLQFRQFWDGRADTLSDQADGPITNPVEMGSRWPDLLARLYKHPAYPGLFSEIYDDVITRNNVKDALSSFEASLLTTNAPFDRYLKGDQNAISKKAKNGYQLFKNYGCISCHQGKNVGGNMFQVFGVINNYFLTRGNITESDYGRYNVTGNEIDRYSFKVPSLRMAKYTPPYLHDGSQATLRDAVNIMFRHQLGREAPDEDKEAIVSFIESLAGEHEEMK
jgi:cytochrome c peroxidase